MSSWSRLETLSTGLLNVGNRWGMAYIGGGPAGGPNLLSESMLYSLEPSIKVRVGGRIFLLGELSVLPGGEEPGT